MSRSGCVLSRTMRPFSLRPCGYSTPAGKPEREAAAIVSRLPSRHAPALLRLRHLRPEHQPSDLAARCAKFFPVQLLASGLHQGFDPTTSGSGIVWSDIGVLALWGAVGLAIALRRCSWDAGSNNHLKGTRPVGSGRRRRSSARLARDYVAEGLAVTMMTLVIRTSIPGNEAPAVISWLIHGSRFISELRADVDF
jgi:hypothetical protein